ncbi:hypothetical protein JOL62DRAFT_216428 [Phyllosticta paracitricarpa]|uniref:Uncharacterized protein n=1 Tax=Phyllosticta paracitricarpa TaxID=2016321 RepID=A0ABR1N2R6_9PEZI
MLRPVISWGHGVYPDDVASLISSPPRVMFFGCSAFRVVSPTFIFRLSFFFFFSSLSVFRGQSYLANAKSCLEAGHSALFQSKNREEMQNFAVYRQLIASNVPSPLQSPVERLASFTRFQHEVSHAPCICRPESSTRHHAIIPYQTVSNTQRKRRRQ